MSRFEDGSYGSQSGIALIAKVLAGRCRMKYTRAAIGKGTIPDDMTPKTMTGCADYVMDAMIAEVSNPVDGECQVTVQIKSDNVEKGFYGTNIVLFAEDPDEGEVAYTYLSLENEPEWIRPASSIVGKLATFDLIAAVGDVDVVEAVIDPDALMTRAAAERLIAESTALSGSEIYIPKDGWKPVDAEQEELEHGLTLYQDIALNGVRADQIPNIAFRKDDIGVANYAGMCSTAQSLDGAIRIWAERTPSRDVEATVSLYDARSATFKEITIPAGGWKQIEDPIDPELNLRGDLAYYQDVVVPGATQDRFPSVSLHIPSLAAARNAGVCRSVQPLAGTVRFWSVKVPEEDLSASIALLFRASGVGLVTSHAVIVDGVKVRKGSGLNVDGDGYLSLDMASSEQVKAMFKQEI